MLISLKHSHYLPIIILALSQQTIAAWKNLTLSDYKLKQSGYSSTIANLDKALPNVNVSVIMGDLNHINPGVTPKVKNVIASSGYGWENSDDFDDQDTKNWYPQGITTSADALDKGTYEGHRVQLISWHSDHYDGGKRGARVSFVKQGSGRSKNYRHVLLVQPSGDNSFKAIDGLHAGGIMWYGNLLYVVDTSGGLRVFDMDHMYKVDGSLKDVIGRQSNGKYGAYGYKYVLPQVRTYDWQSKSGLTDMRFSYISLDRTTTPDSLLVGEYSATRTNCRLVRWDIDYTNRLLKTSGGIATASQAVSHGNVKIQGAATINGKFFLTQSTGSLISWSWVGGKKKTDETFPKVPEDLSYEKGVGLWTLMEVPGSDRVVFALDHTKF